MRRGHSERDASYVQADAHQSASLSAVNSLHHVCSSTSELRTVRSSSVQSSCYTPIDQHKPVFTSSYTSAYPLLPDTSSKTRHVGGVHSATESSSMTAEAFSRTSLTLESSRPNSRVGDRSWIRFKPTRLSNTRFSGSELTNDDYVLNKGNPSRYKESLYFSDASPLSTTATRYKETINADLSLVSHLLSVCHDISVDISIYHFSLSYHMYVYYQ